MVCFLVEAAAAAMTCKCDSTCGQKHDDSISDFWRQIDTERTVDWTARCICFKNVVCMIETEGSNVRHLEMSDSNPNPPHGLHP